MRITYQIAMAAAKDAANRRMKQAGRSKWSRSDYTVAVKEFNRLYETRGPGDGPEGRAQA